MYQQLIDFFGGLFISPMLVRITGKGRRRVALRFGAKMGNGKPISIQHSTQGNFSLHVCVCVWRMRERERVESELEKKEKKGREEREGASESGRANRTSNFYPSSSRKGKTAGQTEKESREGETNVGRGQVLKKVYNCFLCPTNTTFTL